MTSSPAEKSAEAYRTISEVAAALKLPQHVLRFWETRFTQIKPLKRGGNRRYYRPEDVELLAAIRQLLYGDGYTIKGVQRILREQGPRAVALLAQRRPGTSDSPSPTFDEAAVAPAGGPSSAPQSIPWLDAPDPGASAIEPDDPVGQLRALLSSLAECRRLLEAARA